MKLFCLSLLLWSSAFAGASLKCEVSSLTNNCALLKNLKTEDILEYRNGQSTPACILAAVRDTNWEAKEREEKVHTVRIIRVLENVQPPLTKEQLRSVLNTNDLERMFATPPPRISWPPFSDKEENPIRSVTAEEVRAYWAERVGAEGLAELLDALQKRSQIGNVFFRRDLRVSDLKFNIGDQEARLKILFGRAQQAVIQDVLAGREEKQLTAAERDILRRVQALTLSKSFGYPDNCGPYYLAANDYTRNEIIVPPGMMFFPDPSLMRALLHEISHSFDLCRLSGMKEDDITGRDRVLPENGVAQGFPDLSLDASPYYSVHQCLRTEEGGHFIKMNKINKHEPLSREGVCLYNEQHEAFCDWNAARIIAANPQLMKQELAGATPVAKYDTGQVVKAPEKFECIANMVYCPCSEKQAADYKYSSHPSWFRRVDDILFRESVWQKQFGCQGSGKKPCPQP